jgi:hypothetical protein
MTHDKTLFFCLCITCVARRKAGIAITKERPVSDSPRLFFVLWQPESSSPPRVQFRTYAEAVKVAEEMAQRHGKEFYVMKAMAKSAPVRVATTVLR